MPRQPTRLTRSLLAAVRPGVQCFVAEGLTAGVPVRRPRGFGLAPRAGASAAPPAYRAAARAGKLAAQAGALRSQAPAPRSQVATIEIRGALEQRASFWSCGEVDAYDAIEARFVEAYTDPAVCALVLDGDTPGGEGPGLEQTIARMRALVDAHGKPVLWFCNELTASAGLWIAAGVADGIYLPPSGRIGSIGCVVVHQSEARGLAEDGVDTYVARDPVGKMVPNNVEALDELGKARLDALAVEGADRFRLAIAARRGVSVARLRETNGAIYTGAAALAVGLADGLGSLEDVIAHAAELAALQEAA